MSNPITNPKALDFVILAGRRSPGIAEISDADSPRRWDERRGYGNSGARAVFRGVGLSHFKLTIRLYNAEHEDAWNEWRPILNPPRPDTATARPPRAMQIEHPLLEDLGIRAVNVEKVGQLVQTADGEWSVVIDLIEYREPVPALAVPRGTSNGGAPSAGDDPELGENMTTIADLAQALARPIGPR